MTEQSPSLPAADPTPQAPGASASRQRRRRLLVVTAAAAAGLAVIGGVAGGVAAVVSRTSGSPAAAGSGATLFFPAVGQSGNTATNGAGGSAASSGAAMGAGGAVSAGPMALSTQMKGAFGADYAMGMPSYAYPSMGCGSAPPVQVQGDGITASAMVQVPLGSGTQSGTSTLNIGVQTQGGNDVKAALADARARLDAIRAALHKVGIPDSQISQQNFNLWANGSPKPVNGGVNAGLTVTITDAALIDPAITAAADAGASNLNLWSSGGTTAATPSDDQVRTAITKATSQAHTMAQAVAQGTGQSLGSVRASTVQPPSICPWAPGGPQLVVAVSITYAVK